MASTSLANVVYIETTIDTIDRGSLKASCDSSVLRNAISPEAAHTLQISSAEEGASAPAPLIIRRTPRLGRGSLQHTGLDQALHTRGRYISVKGEDKPQCENVAN